MSDIIPRCPDCKIAFRDLPEDAEYEIEGELNRALDPQIGDELESLTIGGNPPKLSEKSQATLLHDELISPYSEPLGKTKAVSFLSAAVILILGTLLLAAQAFHFNSASLSLNPEYRRIVQKFCSYTDCSIGEYRNLDDIEILQFIVQGHPEHYGALSIHLLLNNHAGFEYRLANATIMPRNKSIQIHLEVIDPGDNAKSYAIELTD